MIDKIQQQPQKKTHSAKTVADRNTNLIKVEQVENVNLNINNDNEITTRIPTKIKTANPILRYGNPTTHGI